MAPTLRRDQLRSAQSPNPLQRQRTIISSELITIPRPARRDLNCSNNTGPYQFPEKLIPCLSTISHNNKTLRSMARERMCATGSMWNIMPVPSQGLSPGTQWRYLQYWRLQLSGLISTCIRV
jgi:hypothetical protein